jgi:MoaA/NifB/PqqE/SkfB family radical SAM enzyme
LAITLTTHAHRIDDRLAAALDGNVHFIRVSMDGVGATYERLRGRSFESLLRKLRVVRGISRFGINYVVNSDTVGDLDRAIEVAQQADASEFLLLPERPVGDRLGLDRRTWVLFVDWVRQYRGMLPLRVSEYATEGLQTLNPVADENGLRAYAHVNARGILMRSSFDDSGVAIVESGLMRALEELRNTERTGRHEGLVRLRI